MQGVDSILDCLPTFIADGMHILACKHFFESPSRVRQPIKWSKGGQFYREDRSKGFAHFTVMCADCSKMDHKEVDHHEYIYFYDQGEIYLWDRYQHCPQMRKKMVKQQC